MALTQKHSNFLIVIGGPTGGGKTKVAIQLAKHFQTEIISADSRQVFQEMTIGTAVPSPPELAAAKHHLIQTRSVTEDYSVGEYQRDVLPLLDHLFSTHNPLILTGGSGLYIKAVCEGLDAFPEVPNSIRTVLQQEYEQYGLAYLQRELERLDPDYFAEVDQQNPMRLLRAISVARASGQPYSHFRRGTSQLRNFQPIYIRLEWDRKALYRRIENRVDRMLEMGLIEEARSLIHLKDRTALQTVGYQELFAHFDGQYNLEEAIRLIKRNTRRYAKRQETWFRRGEQYTPFQPEDLSGMLTFIEEQMNATAR